MKNIVLIIVIVLAVGLALWLVKSRDNSVPAVTTNTNQGTDTANTNPTVTYTQPGFNPSPITITVGQTVVFVNNSSDVMWVASDPHPAHTDLPGFDTRRGIPPHDSYSFTFTKIGTFGYHDHLNPSHMGKVIVH